MKLARLVCLLSVVVLCLASFPARAQFEDLDDHGIELLDLMDLYSTQYLDEKEKGEAADKALLEVLDTATWAITDLFLDHLCITRNLCDSKY